MSLPLRIARGLIGSHPEDAARVLERMRDEEVAEVLALADEDEVAATLQALVSPVASRQLVRLPASRAAEVVARLSPDRGADLLRRLEEKARAEILSLVPESERLPVERLLRFPRETAGAMMDPRFLAFHEGRRVEEALADVAERGADLRFYVYVVDDVGVLVGVLSVREAAAAPPRSRLHEVMRRPVETLSARAGKRAILVHPAWQRVPSLPVVDEKARIVGIFRYRTLQELKESPHDEGDPGVLGLALALGELFWWGTSGLFRGLERTDDVP